MGALSATLQSYSNTEDLTEAVTMVTKEESVDIYRGSHPARVLQIRPILQELGDRATALLQSWPDHPALIQVFITLGC